MVYFDQAHYGPVSSGRAEAGFKGGQAVVGSGRSGCGGGFYGGSVGGTSGGGRKDRMCEDGDIDGY